MIHPMFNKTKLYYTLRSPQAYSQHKMVFSPPPKALKMIKENIDRDIAFHQRSGAFALRLRSRVGESIVSSLIERVVRIERLVNFIQILQAQ